LPEVSGVIVVGGGVAGCSVAAMLANAGRASTVTIFESETGAPYDRPPLTKTFLAEQDTLTAWPAWAPRDVNWRRERVARVDVRERSVTTESGAVLLSDVVVIAVGARARRLAGRPDRIITIRTADDARVLRDVVHGGGRRFLIEGAGPLGLEIASTLAAAGAQVTVVDVAPKPLMRLAGGVLADEVLSWAVEAGVTLLLGRSVTEVRPGEGQRAVIARIDGRESKSFDAMVSAVGVAPSPLSVLEDSSEIPEPFITDVHGRLLNASGSPVPGVYAVGDATGVMHSDGRVTRSEAWTAARVQGEVVARHLMGASEDPSRPPYFWTRIFGRMVQIVGDIPDGSMHELVAEVPQVNGRLFRVATRGATVGYVGVNAQKYMARLQMQTGDPAHWVIPGV